MNEVLSKCSIRDIEFRLGLINAVIEEAQQAGDERWKNLVSQQTELSEALVEKRIANGEKPEPIVVNLKTLNFKATKMPLKKE